jgi:tRNA (guanine37-N1)-methyltransferase
VSSVTGSGPRTVEAGRPGLVINVVTLFPEVLAPYLATSIPGRAAAMGRVAYRLVQLRDFTHDRHRTVDDYPYGGGPGMVLKPEPFFEAVESLEEADRAGPIVLLSARGRRFEHRDAVRLSLGPRLTLLCGHYKDVDQRVAEGLATEELSLGDFVLSGGEPAALCVIDAVVRLVPGVLGDHESASGDSYYDDGLLSPPSYTRPPEYRGMRVPEVLLSGHHAEIAAWRRAQAERLTAERRPDLWERYRRTHEPGQEPRERGENHGANG